jgi:hypothetical protein
MKAFVVLLVCILLLPAVPVSAKQKAKAPPEPAVEEKAKQALDKSCKALAGLKNFSFVAKVTLDRVYQDGSKIQIGRTMQVSAARPSSFRIVTTGDDIQVTSVFDGKQFTLALPDKKVFGQIDAAMDTDALMDMLAAQYAIESPLGDMLSNAPCSQMDISAGFFVGKATVDDVVCDHLFFQGKGVDWQLWVEDGPAGLPRKLIITEKKQLGMPQFTAVFSAWKTEPISKETFAYTPPGDFKHDDGVIVGRKANGN